MLICNTMLSCALPAPKPYMLKSMYAMIYNPHLRYTSLNAAKPTHAYRMPTTPPPPLQLPPSRRFRPLNLPTPLGHRNAQPPIPQPIHLHDANLERRAGHIDPTSQHKKPGAEDEVEFGFDFFPDGGVWIDLLIVIGFFVIVGGGGGGRDGGLRGR